jgi:hypothetical protein
LIQKNEVLLKHNNEWLHFANPQRVIHAEQVDDVRSALQEIERLVEKNNWHAAGFVRYKAAPTFNNTLRALNTGEFPHL